MNDKIKKLNNKDHYPSTLETVQITTTTTKTLICQISLHQMFLSPASRVKQHRHKGSCLLSLNIQTLRTIYVF